MPHLRGTQGKGIGYGAALVLAAALGSACGGEDPATTLPPAPPSATPLPTGLVLVVIDTLRADLGAALAGEVAAPNVERLARAGARFEHAFAHASSTVPSHAALFASRLPHECGVVANGQQVRADVPLLAEHLRDQGWQTLAVISLGSVLTGDLRRGFEVWGPAADQFIAEATAVRARLVEVLDHIDPERPFFLFAHFSDPHEPYNDHGSDAACELRIDGGAPERLTTSVMTHLRRELDLAPGEHRLELTSSRELRLRSISIETPAGELEPTFLEGQLKLPAERLELAFTVPEGDGPCQLALWVTDHPAREEVPGRYASEVEYVDAELGVLLDELEARGLDERALIVLTSDHGESIGERRFIGHTRTLHDELLRVPLVIRPPAGSDRTPLLRARSQALVGLMDVVPTALDLLGLPPLEGQLGNSLLDAFPERPIVAETSAVDRMSGQSRLRLIALRDANTKLVHDVRRDRFELYLLEADPGEREDRFEQLGDEHAEWARALRALAEQARASEGELAEDALETLRALGYVK